MSFPIARRQRDMIVEAITLPPPLASIVQSYAYGIGIPDEAIGARVWEEHCGDVGEEPCLPNNFYALWEQLKDRHFLVLSPETINGEDLTINSMENVAKRPLKGHATQYAYCLEKVAQGKLGREVSNSRWIVITRDNLPDTQDKSPDELQAMIKAPYGIPRARHLVISLMIIRIATGIFLFGESIYTRCQEWVSDPLALSHPIVTVGNNRAAGLDIRYAHREDCGCAGMIELEPQENEEAAG